MRKRLFAALLIATALGGESLVFGAQISSSTTGAPADPAQTPAQTVVLPAGTAVPLTLVTPIKSKSTRPGDAVRAEVAFPVTSGTRLAIPAGAYVEGVVTKLTPRASGTKQPAVQIHFTRLLFANGYSVQLDAENTQAEAVPPITVAPTDESAAGSSDPAVDPAKGSFGFAAQQTPAQPSLPQEGPSPAVVTGAVVGGMVAFTVGVLAWAHHRRNSFDYVVFDAGWQFQMVLASPLTLDAARVAVAAAAPGAE